MAKTYENAGVNLEAGYEVVRRIKQHVASTRRIGSMGNIGSFGGMFDLSALNVKEPVLVSGTDGVGTKLKIAFAMDKHDTIGIDAVAMCVNDVLAQGAEPLIFLDYVALGHNVPAKVEAIVAGVAEGCRQAGCALVGGETAEMPGMYEDGEYDIAGYTTGVVEKSKLIDGSKVKVGDVCADESVDMGPLVEARALESVTEKVERAIKQGAKLLCGGHRVGTKGYFYAATVLDNCRQDMDIIHEETFGPVIPLIEFSDIDEAIKYANDCEYGLASSIFTKDLNIAVKACRELEFGETYVNREHFEAIQGFHAGVKKSGIGGADGKHGVDEYLVTHVTYLDTYEDM